MERVVSGLVLHGCPIHVRTDTASVEALGIEGNHVLAAGTLAEVRAAMPGAEERVLADGAVLPAFVDPHQHAFLIAADPYVDVLHGAPDLTWLVDLVKRTAMADAEGGGWLRLHGYLPLDLAERRSPTAAELDVVCPDRPVHVLSRTYHESSVNSAGLAALGITAATPDPPGGAIVRDRRGRPTGVLIEAASFAAEAVSRPAETDWPARLSAYGRRLTSAGIVAIGDAAVPAAAASAFVETLAAVAVDATPLLVGHTITSPALVPGQVGKVLLDGGERCHFDLTPAQVRRMMWAVARVLLGPDAVEARAISRATGAPKRSRDGHWHYGEVYAAGNRLPGLLREAAEAGSGLALHAVGNGAVIALLEVLSRDKVLAGQVPVRIEHAMTVDADLVRRLADLGAPVVVQPAFLRTHTRQLTVMPVPAPLKVLPLRAFVDAGATLAFGSDYPAGDLSPWSAIAASVTRSTGSRPAQLHSEEAITVSEAIEACTFAAASVLGRHDAGTLEPGMRADLQWVDKDPFRADPAELATTTTLATWSSGRLVHQHRRRSDPDSPHPRSRRG
ncbi:MAG TPA: amidohydrolase family protein [Propionicimonas sp.]|nr:amidohydrolase family protein [Propionicimonas sp.]